MIIYFEGISCAGKTSLIRGLQQKIENSIFLEELPSNFKELKIDNFDLFCRDNDIKKEQDALFLSKEFNYVLVDRGHASTLCYNYIQYYSDNISVYLNSLLRYYENINKNLLKPDLYVYVNSSGPIAIDRAKNNNKFHEKDYRHKSLTLGNKFYNGFFNILEPEINRIELYSDINFDENLGILYEYIKSLSLNK